MQFNCSVICPTDISLLERDGTSSVLDSSNDGENETFPAPVTGYFSPLALTIRVHCGEEISTKSFESLVM